MSTNSITQSLFKIGVVIGSQRVVRICPEVTQFVLDVIQMHQHQSTSESGLQFQFATVDIADFDLPLTDEPGIPSHLTSRPDGYATERTRTWSKTIESFDGFIFVAPQYNWGVPAALKNALDHLFHEWSGKPAMVVAYGGQAGTLSAAQLITVLSGMFMRVIKKPVCMKFGDKAILGQAFRGEQLGLDAQAEGGLWIDQKQTIIEVWKEMIGLLRVGKSKPEVRSVGLLEMWMETLKPLADIEKQVAKAK